MKEKKKTSRFSTSLAIKQFPWNLSKLIRFKRRKWLKIKFSARFSNLKKIGKAFNFRFFRTYKKKIKKLFQLYFAPNLTSRQCKKVFMVNTRYKATFQKILKLEHRIDMLAFRLYMLPDINIVRDLIKKNYFLVNNKIVHSSASLLFFGDILSISNKFAWHFLYQNMLKVISSMTKYLNRLFFKFSFPFVIKRHNFHFREFGKSTGRILKSFNPILKNRITTRNLYLRYKKVKQTTTSKKNPPLKYYFKQPKNPELFRTKRLKTYILKEKKTNTTMGLSLQSYKNFNFLKTSTFIRYKKLRRQIKLIQNLSNLKTNKKQLKLKKPSTKRFLSKKNRNFHKIRLQKRKNKILITLNQIQNISPRLKAFLKMTEGDSKIKKQIKVLRSLTNYESLHEPVLMTSKQRPQFIVNQVKIKTKFKLFNLFLKKKKLKNQRNLSQKVNTMITKNDFKKFAKQFHFNFFSKKNRHFQFFLSSKKKIVDIKFLLQTRRPHKPRWSKWSPKHSKNFWQVNRLTKKNLYFFRYLKKFNNKYKQHDFFKNLKEISWRKINNKFWQKNMLVFEKKKRKLLSLEKAKGLLYVKKKTRISVFYKKHILNSPFMLVNPLSRNNTKKEKIILRIKRKYLRLKGCFRQYKQFKVQIQFNPQNLIYDKIKIQYKKINLFFKHRPIAFFFAETNYTTLDSTIVGDVDLLYFPYKTLFDFKTLSLEI